MDNRFSTDNLEWKECELHTPILTDSFKDVHRIHYHDFYGVLSFVHYLSRRLHSVPVQCGLVSTDGFVFDLIFSPGSLRLTHVFFVNYVCTILLK